MPSINWKLRFDVPLQRELPYSTSLLTSAVKSDLETFSGALNPIARFIIPIFIAVIYNTPNHSK